MWEHTHQGHLLAKLRAKRQEKAAKGGKSNKKKSKGCRADLAGGRVCVMSFSGKIQADVVFALTEPQLGPYGRPGWRLP